MIFAKRISPLVLLLVLLSAEVSGAPETQTPVMISDVYPGLATSALTHARLSDLPAGVLLRCGEIRFTQADLNDRLSMFPANLQSKVKMDPFYMLEAAIGEALIYSEAYDWSLASKVAKDKTDELIASYLDSVTKNVAVTEDEITLFYEENKQDLGGMQLSQVKEDIRKAIMDNKRVEVVTAHIAAFGERYDIEVDKNWASKQYPKIVDNPIEKARKSGKPLLVDFGSTSCPPCQRLTPILAELKKEYAGKAEVLVIDVDNEPILGSRYGAAVIPTQIFYDNTGKEIFRHAGFYSKANIVAKLAEIGAK